MKSISELIHEQENIRAGIDQEMYVLGGAQIAHIVKTYYEERVVDMDYELRWVKREEREVEEYDNTGLPKIMRVSMGKVLQYRFNITDRGVKWSAWKDVPTAIEDATI
jgi:hypothetical protein